MSLSGVGGRRIHNAKQSCTHVLLICIAPYGTDPCGIPVGSAAEAWQFTLPFIAKVSSFTLYHEPVLLSDPVLSMRKQ